MIDAQAVRLHAAVQERDDFIHACCLVDGSAYPGCSGKTGQKSGGMILDPEKQGLSVHITAGQIQVAHDNR